MAIENITVSVSGAVLPFAGEHALSMVMLVAQSGTTFVPVQATSEGYLISTGSVA